MKLLKYWKPITVALVILYGSITPGSNLTKVNFLNIIYFDKIMHFLLYFVFSVTLLGSITKHSLLNQFNKIALTLTIAVSYGLLMESFQFLFTTDRSPELLDAAANTLGAFFGIIVFPLLVKIKLSQYL